MWIHIVSSCWICSIYSYMVCCWCCCICFSSIQVTFYIRQCSWRICSFWSVNSCFYWTCYSIPTSIWFCIEDLVTRRIFFASWIYLVAIFICVHYRCDCIVCRRLVIYFHSDGTNTFVICFTRYDSCTCSNKFHFVGIFYCVGVILSQIICLFIRRYNPPHITQVTYCSSICIRYRIVI